MKTSYILPLIQPELVIDLILAFLITISLISLTIFTASKASKLGKLLGNTGTGIIVANNSLSLIDRLIGGGGSDNNNDKDKDKKEETKTESTSPKDNPANDSKDKVNDTKKD